MRFTALKKKCKKTAKSRVKPQEITRMLQNWQSNMIPEMNLIPTLDSVCILIRLYAARSEIRFVHHELGYRKNVFS